MKERDEAEEGGEAVREARLHRGEEGEGLMSDHSFVFKARTVGVKARGGEEENGR